MSEWKIEEPPGIRKTFKRLGQDEKNQYRSAIRTLAKSDNPRTPGEFIKTSRTYTYQITGSFRISYDISFEDHIIYILAIGDHKIIHGKDKHS